MRNDRSHGSYKPIFYFIRLRSYLHKPIISISQINISTGKISLHIHYFLDLISFHYNIHTVTANNSECKRRIPRFKTPIMILRQSEVITLERELISL